jgi:manganese/iron transport system permease protein
MSETLLYLTWPFQFPFMQQAFLIGVLVAVPSALLSCFLVLKGWSLMGDAVSHAVLPGVVIAYLVGLPIGIGAFTAGMACALGVGFLKEHSRIKEDTVMGVVFSGMFGLGVVLITAFPSDVHLDHILFGNMLGAGWSDIVQAAIIGLVVLVVILAKWRDLMLFIFDPGQAAAIGLPVRALHYGLLALLSLTIVGALQAVGIILVIALLVAPGAIAFLITRRFSTMLMVATALSVLSTSFGIYASFWLDSAPAPTIVLLMTITFIIVFILTTWRDRQAAQPAA